MAVKEDFTEDEWKTMQRGVTGAGMLVSFADADVRDGLAEAKALTKFLSEEHEHGRSSLVRDLADIPLRRTAVANERECLRKHSHDRGRGGGAVRLGLGPDVHHPRGTGLVEVREVGHDV